MAIKKIMTLALSTSALAQMSGMDGQDMPSMGMDSPATTPAARPSTDMSMDSPVAASTPTSSVWSEGDPVMSAVPSSASMPAMSAPADVKVQTSSSSSSAASRVPYMMPGMSSMSSMPSMAPSMGSSSMAPMPPMSSMAAPMAGMGHGAGGMNSSSTGMTMPVSEGHLSRASITGMLAAVVAIGAVLQL